MEPDAFLSWLTLTPASASGLASRLSARLLKEFGSPEKVFRAPLPYRRRIANADPHRSSKGRATRGRTTAPAGSGAAELRRGKIFELLGVDESRHIDDIVERSGLHSCEVLATLFDLEMKGLIRQLPGKQFSKVLL